jgi:hypothetical protein
MHRDVTPLDTPIIIPKFDHVQFGANSENPGRRISVSQWRVIHIMDVSLLSNGAIKAFIDGHGPPNPRLQVIVSHHKIQSMSRDVL